MIKTIVNGILIATMLLVAIIFMCTFLYCVSIPALDVTTDNLIAVVASGAGTLITVILLAAINKAE